MRNTLSQLLPEFIKRPMAAYIRAIVHSDPSYLCRLEALRSYLPSCPGEAAYSVSVGTNDKGRFPIPPRQLWVDGYGEDAESYISRGKAEVANMARILEEGGFALNNCQRVLEFGCAAARMLRHISEFATKAELWGVDISAPHIQWCVNNLTPRMHFATTTIFPHLPFEDRYFDLVFCGSVFTHIEDLQQTWLLELSRVLRTSGRLFLTIHDEHTVELLETSYRGHWLQRLLQEESVYTSNRRNFDMIVIGRGPASQVFYNSQYLKSILPPFFRWVSHTTEAYGYQSAVVLEKRGTS